MKTEKENLKLIAKDWKKIEETFGINALERIKENHARLWETIRQTMKSRDKWKEKYYDLKKVKGGKEKC